METGNRDRPLAIVRRFNPLVMIRHATIDDWIDAVRTHPLHDSDTLRTGEDGFAVVQFMDNSIARVRPNSLLIVNGEVRAPDNTSSRIAIEVGDMFLNIRSTNSNYEVATPSAVAAVRGTEFSTRVTGTGQTFFTGFSGQVDITALSSGQGATLRRGMGAEVDADGEEITLSDLTDDGLNSLYALYQDEDDDPETRIIRLRFVNSDGEVEVIEFEYYEVDPDDE